jgi:predicted metal-dependent hydrolase
VFRFIQNLIAQPRADDGFLTVSGRRVPLVFVRSRRARRYLLRLRPDGSARLTIPNRGSLAEGRRFAERSTGWLARQLAKNSTRPIVPSSWHIGTAILFRGHPIVIAADINESSAAIRLGDEYIPVPEINRDLRPSITRHLGQLAAAELPRRTFELAAAHQLIVKRVTVRNQRSRWGSCSRRGTISLNWRLIQAPPFVCDYIILHELMHLREMNHSSCFWREVKQVCPEYQTAEKWLKQNASLLK